jgi:hypothetical protein
VVQSSKPTKPPYARPIEVVLRSIHIVSMGLVLGGIPMGGTRATLLIPIIMTVTSGLLLLAACMVWGCFNFTQGAGWALILKMGFLGLGNIFEGASVGSHMMSSWRHYSFPIRALRPASGPGARAA